MMSSPYVKMPPLPSQDHRADGVVAIELGETSGNSRKNAGPMALPFPAPSGRPRQLRPYVRRSVTRTLLVAVLIGAHPTATGLLPEACPPLPPRARARAGCVVAAARETTRRAGVLHVLSSALQRIGLYLSSDRARAAHQFDKRAYSFGVTRRRARVHHVEPGMASSSPIT